MGEENNQKENRKILIRYLDFDIKQKNPLIS